MWVGLRTGQLYELEPVYSMALIIDLLIIGHYELWQTGFYHCDINPCALMYYRDAQGSVVGVLNDFGRAAVASRDDLEERTGTLPFLAKKLLLSELKDVSRRYGLSPASSFFEGVSTSRGAEYDVESFVYVLLWITRRFKEGKKVIPAYRGIYRDWLIVDRNIATITVRRERALQDVGQDQTRAYGECTELVKKLCGTLCLHLIAENAHEWGMYRIIIDQWGPQYYAETLYEKFMKKIEEDASLKGYSREGVKLDPDEA